MIGPHDTNGRLAAGIHTATWAEFVARFGGTPRRVAILARVAPAIYHLAACGCPSILVGGSFVTQKPNPGDIDFVWAVRGVDMDAVHPAFTAVAGANAVKAQFGADIFPSDWIEEASGEPFFVFFQHTSTDEPTGAVAVDLSTLPDDEDAT